MGIGIDKWYIIYYNIVIMNKMKLQFNDFSELQKFFNCPNCNNILSQIWENVGFSSPNPQKTEFSHYSCKSCGNKYSHEDLEKLYERKNNVHIK